MPFFRLILCLLLLFFLFPTSVRADTLVFEEDFSVAHFTEWEQVRSSRHDDSSLPCSGFDGPIHWEFQDEARLHIIDSPPCSTELVPKSEEARGIRSLAVEFRMYISQPEMDRNLLLRWKDQGAYLGFHLFGSAINVEKTINGVPAFVENGSRGYQFQKNTWYSIRMEHDPSTKIIRLFINSQLVIDAKEKEAHAELFGTPPGLAGSVGLVRTSYAVYSDYRLFSRGNENSLPVERLLQRDSRWAHLEYDSALTWSPDDPTMKRWGCALTSGVMVLRYFGITTLPGSASPLFPDTLNAWLISQSDGYYPGGAVNWRALSRLSHEQKNNLGTPALEFSYHQPTEKLLWLRQQLSDRRPVILAQPGHFVTAYGYGHGESDFYLHDPFYSYTDLSSYKNEFLSARLFTPSQTDLSAISLVTPLTVKARFLSPEGHEIETYTSLEYRSIENKETEPLFVIYDIAKPVHETIDIEFETANELVAPVFITIYNSSGEFSSRKVVVQPGVTSISLSILSVTITSSSETELDYFEEDPFWHSDWKDEYAFFFH